MKTLITILCLVALGSLFAATRKPVKMPPPLPKVKAASKSHLATLKRLASTGAIVSQIAAQDHSFVSATKFGDIASDTSGAVAADALGNAYVAGTRQIETGSKHPFVMKRNPTGGIVLSNIIPGNMTGEGKAVAADSSGNIYFGGWFLGTIATPSPITSVGYSDGFLIKIAPNGSYEWAKRFGGGSGNGDFGNTVSGLAIDPATGDVAITGYFAGTTDFGGGQVSASSGQSYYVARFSKDGAFKWARFLGSTANTFGNAVTIDPQGNVIVGGGVERFMNLNATWNFGGGTVPVTNSVAFVVKYSSAGAFQWVRQFGPWAQVIRVANDPGGNIAAAGWYRRSISFGQATLTNFASPFDPQSGFVFELNSSGVSQWSQPLGPGIGNGIAFRNDGTVLATLNLNKLVSYTSAGIPRWTNSFNGLGGSVINVGVAAGANIFVAGQFSPGADFGGGTMTSAGSQDGFLVELGMPQPVTVGQPEPPMAITNIDGALIVIAIQRAGKQLDFWGSERFDEGTSWPFHLATFSAVPDEQPVGIEVGRNHPQLIVKAINSTPSAFLPASATPQLNDTGRRVSAFGKVAKIYKVNP